MTRWSRGGSRRRVRLNVLDRDGWQCQMPTCLCPNGRQIDPAVTDPDDPWSPSIDHVGVKADGGTDARLNLRAAHRECNLAAGRHYNERTLPARRRRTSAGGET
jgi:5-methylcytosine-specific restriction endonuclease McrA